MAVTTAAGNNQDKPIWLVKASGRVLGPYNIAQVTLQLRERRLSLIDEIRSPGSRWQFMRELPDLQPVIEAIREEQDSMQDNTQAILDGQKTVKDFDTDELTPTPTWVNRPAIVTETKPVTVTVPARSYGMTKDPRLMKNIRETSKQISLAAWVAVAILGIAAATSFYSKPKVEVAPKALGYEDYIRLAKYNKTLGAYDKSLDFFRKAEQVKALDNNSLMLMAPVLMLEEKNYIEARRMLETVIKNMNPDPKLSLELQTLMALTYIGEGRTDDAKQILTNLAELKPPSVHVLADMMILLILKGAHRMAFDQTSELINSGVKEPTLTLVKAIAAANSFTKEDAEKSKQMVQELTVYLDKHKEYLVEGLLIKAVLQFNADEKIDAVATLQNMFDELPELSKSHIHDILIEQQIFNWEFLFPLCEKLYTANAETPLFQTLKAYCHWQKEDYPQAMGILEKAYKQDSKNISLNTVYAYVLKRSERSDEAKVILKSAPESKLTSLISAEWCVEDANWNCAEQSWKAVLAKDPVNVVAIHGLARKAQEIGQSEKAKELVRQGLLVSGNYRPLVELKEQLDAE